MIKSYFIKLIAIPTLLLLLALSGSCSLFAEPLFQFQTLTKKDGLSSSVVYDVAQDKDGFMWIATEDGLQKYDGYDLVTYRQNRLNSKSISNNVVRTLLIDKNNTLWVGTDNGLNIYQKKLDVFELFSFKNDLKKIHNINRIRALYQTKDGMIWVGSSAGLTVINPKNHTTHYYETGTVRTIYEDDRKQLWVGTLNKGLFLFDRNTSRFMPVHFTASNNDQSKTSALSIVGMYKDSFGRILVATWGQGVFVLKKDLRSLSKYDLNLPSQYVRTIHQDKRGDLWIGTRQGILIYQPAEKKSQLIQANDRNQASLILDNITKIYQGADDTIWIGTYGGGVSRHFPYSRRFESFGLHRNTSEGLIDPIVYSISENHHGDIWIGTETGKLAKFLFSKMKFEHHKISIAGKENQNSILAVLQLNDDVVLLGTSSGLIKYSLKEKIFERFDVNNNDFLSSIESVNFISRDKLNRIWIGMRNIGVRAFEIDKNNNLLPISELKLDIVDPLAISYLGDNHFLVASSSNGVLETELEDLNNGSYKIKSSILPNTEGLNVYDINKDWKGRVWLSTWSDGIKIITTEGQIVHLDETNGLSNNSVYKIIPDINSQKIWASTNNGIVSIDSNTLDIASYTSLDGLQSNEFNKPGILSSNGYLYFGGTNGLDRFYPSIIEKSLFVKPPVIVGLSVANKEIKIKPSGILTQSIDTIKVVELKYNQTPFSFKFTSAQYVKSNDLEFRYRLLGLDNEWINAPSDLRRATYTNIHHGEYRFELQVRENKGDWINDTASINVNILPPWWNTLLAKIFYSAVCMLIIGLISYSLWKKRQKEKQVQFAIKENEERLKLSLWGSGYEFWDWNLESGDISRSNEFKKIQIESSKLSKNLYQLVSYIHPSDLAMVREQLNSHIAGNSKHFDICYRIVDSKNGWRWIQDRGKVVAVDNEGNALRMSGTQRDITDIRQRDEQFEMLGQAFKSTSDGVWIRDHEWRLIECNPAYERITGFPLSEKKGESLWFPDTSEQPENIIQRIHTNIEEKGNWQGEAWAERKNNDPFPQKLSIDTLHDEKGNVRYYVGVFSDITFHKRTEEEFRKLANYDSLTSLPNRACLYDRLNQTIEKTKRDKGRFALFLVDIDNFKRINDSLGHSVGDMLIRQVASRLVNCNKEGDTVARIGGDEFVIVVENIKSSAAVAAFSELLLKELNQPVFVKGQQLKLNFSVGITLAPDDAIIAERLIRNADTAMYEAKKAVDNSYRFYAVEFNERARKRLELENALRKAIEDETIELYYQPKVDLNTGLVEGIEALARWTHKELGCISPVEFIPLAEETGLIIPLGHSLLRQAARHTKDWVDRGLMKGRTSVNLSANQFWNCNLASEISQILKEEGLDNRYIELEITESACMQDMEETKAQIKILKSLGFTLALDDFGTGYSSLAQLKSLPFDTLKVDKSFVDNIETDAQDAKVVKAIIDIAKTMEMKVIIEGVESKSQCEYLWMNRAYYVQGFHFSRPVRSSLVPETLTRRWHRQEYLGNISGNVTPLA